MMIFKYLTKGSNLVSRVVKDLLKHIVFQVGKIDAVLKCVIFQRRYKKPVNRAKNNLLSNFYPDNGYLSNGKGFETGQPTLDLSIIIPMCNAAQYIGQCMKSIFNQPIKYTYEIILVDDGSTDNTVDVIQEFLDITTVHLLKQENQGQSVARNRAISKSRGRYIMFVDSDDILLPGSIDILLDAAISTGSEIAEGNVARFTNEITDEIINYYTGKKHVESNKTNPHFVLTTYGYSVAKVYERRLWENVRFPEGYIFEDMITKYILRRKANQVCFTGSVVYGYRYNDASSSHGKNHLKKLDSIWVLPKIFSLCDLNDVPKDDTFYILALNNIGLTNYVTTRPFDEEVRLACFSEMRKQLISIQECRTGKMPLMFRILEKSILSDQFDSWEMVAGTICKYNLLKKWREIN